MDDRCLPASNILWIAVNAIAARVAMLAHCS
jgi:hypothetical protein